MSKAVHDLMVPITSEEAWVEGDVCVRSGMTLLSTQTIRTLTLCIHNIRVLIVNLLRDPILFLPCIYNGIQPP